MDNTIDLTPVCDTLMSYVNPILTVVFTIIGIFALARLIYLGVQVIKVNDPNERSEVWKKILYWFLGLVFCALAVILVNVIFPIIFNGQTLDLGS